MAHAATRERHRSTGRPGVGRPGVLWALPGALFFVFFAVAPMVLFGVLAFTDWDGIGTPSWTGMSRGKWPSRCRRWVCAIRR